jgi:SRSO17 transposase
MKPRELKRLDQELTAYTDSLIAGMGRAERRQAMADYVTGLLLDGDRKSIEPMAGRLVDDVTEIQAMRQRLQQCVTVSPWRDDEMWQRLAIKGDAELPDLEAWVVDDTGFPKKGIHSVGVQRQYSGTLGRRDNCQVAVSLHLAGERGSACIGMQLVLPESWTSGRERCRAVGVPGDISFQKKWEISLSQIDSAMRWGVGRQVVLADAGYGDVTEYRDGLVARGLEYVVGIQGTLSLWPPGAAPIPPPSARPAGHGGKAPCRWKTGEQKPMPALELAASRGRSACRIVHWREPSRGPQKSSFGSVRVRCAHHHLQGVPPGEEQWLLYEWPATEPEPTKLWLATLPASATPKELIHLAKLRWRVERDYQEMKQEMIGLDHFEGRGWRGFHHHATPCGVAHGFLALRRALSPPEEDAVDSARGSAPVAAGAAPAARYLPALPPQRRRGESAKRAFANVIE